MINAFLLGVIATECLAAALFFVKFWRDTRDLLFMAFAFFFVLEAGNRITLLFFAHPNEGSPGIYIVRLIGLLIILAAILDKNYGKSS